MQRRLFTVSGLFLMLWATPLVALAQEEANQPVNSTPIGEDNEVLDQFKRVEARYIPRGEWSRVVRYYQKQLDRTDHGLFSEDGELYLPLSVYCHHRIARLPEAGIVAYRRRVDPEANRLYAEAKSTTRLEPLRKLLRFYFNSTIGDEALLFAGSLYMELGRFRQALKVMRQIHPKLGPGHLHYPNSQLDLNPIQARIAYCLARLGEKFELTDLFRSWDYAAYWGEQLGQTNREDLISLASSAKSRRKASQTNWPYVYGGANHTNQAPRAGQITGPMQWIFPDSQIKVRQLFQGRFSRTWKKPTIAQTVVVIKGERLYTIQDDKIQAVNLFDGRLVWEADTDNQVSIATRSGWSSTMPGGEAIKNWRMVADPVANSLSLVGKHLFSIQRTRPRFMSRGTNKWQGSNTLRVYDTTKEYPEGSLSQVPAFGGAQEKREVFKNTYWLSTPVAYEGNIYLTAEQEGSYKIFCLNASTLQLLWVSHAAGVTDTAAQWYQIQSRAAAGSLSIATVSTTTA